MYPNRLWIIFKQIYLTQRLDSKRYYHLGQNKLGSNDNEEILNTSQISKTEASSLDAV